MIMAEEVKVFGMWISPYSRRAELALKLKGISYEYMEEDLVNKSPLFLKYNPVHKKIPVLLHNGKPIAESLVVLEYIDETWEGYSIMPEDPYQKAMVRFWAKCIDEKCGPAIRIACWSEGKKQEKAMEEAWEHLRTLENELKGKKFFGGETIGFVDIVANFIAFWVGVLQKVAGITLVYEEKFPIVCGWIEQFLSCDVVKECLPTTFKLARKLSLALQPNPWFISDWCVICHLVFAFVFCFMYLRSVVLPAASEL